MNANRIAFEAPGATTRNDTMASGAVLVSILLGALFAALVF